MVRRAIDTFRRFRIAVWDAMIIEAARSAGCDRVLTEYLQAGQDFDGITIDNPFARYAWKVPRLQDETIQRLAPSSSKS